MFLPIRRTKVGYLMMKLYSFNVFVPDNNKRTAIIINDLAKHFNEEEECRNISVSVESHYSHNTGKDFHGTLLHH